MCVACFFCFPLKKKEYTPTRTCGSHLQTSSNGLCWYVPALMPSSRNLKLSYNQTNIGNNQSFYWTSNVIKFWKLQFKSLSRCWKWRSKFYLWTCDRQDKNLWHVFEKTFFQTFICILTEYFLFGCLGSFSSRVWNARGSGVFGGF